MPFAGVLENSRLVVLISAELQEAEATLSNGKTLKTALARPQGQARGSILMVREWWGLVWKRQ